ncbi:MAG: hypothetical protein IKE24_08155 [Clostridia bacterium]|nr:hypothetical protein [Clostridia bacterium]
MRKVLFALLFSLFVSSAFADAEYTRIDQETAKAMMAADDGHVVVDVRRQDEYDAGHIPGAVLIPNESIGCDSPEALPNYDQIILIYCRSGRRSKEAAQKLASMGYTQIYEFGGIIDWTGEVVKTMKIRVSDGTNTIIYQLNDSPSARSLYGMLPMDTAVENYGSNEKIFYPEQTIDPTDGTEGGGKAGGLALFSPWGNVVMYYDSFASYPGLYILGEAVEGAEQVKNLSGTIHVEAVE